MEAQLDASLAGLSESEQVMKLRAQVLGLQLKLDEWKEVVKRVEDANIPWIIKPTLRFKGMPGEQWTCFFKDPSNNNLEFKAMGNPELLFAKYNVAEG